MIVQRYKATNGYGGDSDIIADDAGEIVLHTDYAALEARCARLTERCAGLERERDKLQRHYDRCRCTVMDLEQQRDVALDERDALQAKLAAAEGTLLEISRLPYCDAYMSKARARSALADTTTGEVQR